MAVGHSWSSLMLILSVIYTSNYVVPCSAISVPPTTGSYGVGVRSYAIPFIDNHNVAWPGNKSTSYLATIYYPTARTNDEEVTPYMDPDAAKILEVTYEVTAGGLGNLTTNIKPNASIAQPSPESLFPTLIFQPGFEGPTVMYSILLSELASQGYAVVALDFPYEAAFVRYPNGTGVTGTYINADLVTVLPLIILDLYEVRLRVGTHFVEIWPALVEQLNFPFRTTSLGVVGQSFGGAGSFGVADAVPDTSIVTSALNLDGELYGDPASNISSIADLSRPVLTMGRLLQAGQYDPSWTASRTAQTGPWRILTVAGTDHLDFSDVAFWRVYGETFQVGGNSTIDPVRMVNITREFVAAFFNQTILNQTEVILGQPGADWPEVAVLAQGNYS